MTPEGRIKADCLRYLERRGILSWNNPSGVIRISNDRWIHFGKKGSADIIGILPDGKFLAVETKSVRGRLTPEQKEFLEKVRGMGGVAILARSLRELDEALREAGYAMKDMPLFEGNNAAPYGGA